MADDPIPVRACGRHGHPEKGTSMILDCAHYRDGRRQDAGAIPLEEAAARCSQGGFVWLGLFESLEEGDVKFVILRTARYDDEREEVEFGEISVFLGPTFVITVRQGVASDLHGARLRIEAHPELLAAGTAAALWAILDKVIDDYAPVVEGLERDIEEVERT